MGLVVAPDDQVIVAVDGGNSKTDVAVVQQNGVVLVTTRGPAASPHLYGTRQAVLAIETMVRGALARVGRTLGPADVLHAGAYLAGVDLPREQTEIMSVVTEHNWAQTVSVDNDTFALLRIGSPTGYGVAVVCGAGINCVAIDQDLRIVRFPSLGQISGDWGGGAQLGGEVMFAASRAEDGRGDETLLRQAVIEHFDARDILQVIERMHFKEIPEARIHELAPVLFAVADRGDPVAAKLVDRLAAEVSAYAIASLRRLGMLDSPASIVLGGGVLAARHHLVVQGIESRVREVAAQPQFIYVSDAPIAGAVLLALDFIGATAGASVEAMVRESYATDGAAGARSLITS